MREIKKNKNLPKKSRNLEKKISKYFFFSQKIRFLSFFLLLNKKKYFLSLIEDISLQPELSSQPRLRIKGGYPERDIGVGVAGLYFGRFDNALVDSFIIQDGEELPKEQK